MGLYLFDLLEECLRDNDEVILRVENETRRIHFVLLVLPLNVSVLVDEKRPEVRTVK